MDQLIKKFDTLSASKDSTLLTDIDSYGKSCMENNDYEGVVRAIEGGAHLETLLDIAIKYGRVNIASYLVDCGAKVHSQLFLESMTMVMRQLLIDAYEHQ